MTIALTTGMASAIPVQQGVWRWLTLADGTQVYAEMRGDHRLVWWAATDGKTYVKGEQPDIYVEADLIALQQGVAQREANLMKRKRAFEQRAKARRKTELGEKGDFTGVKKGLVIMVEFSNRKFPTRHGQTFFQRVMTEPGFTHAEGFRGSVRDYFLAQSDSLFDLQIDVVGPVQLSKTYQYYGADSQQAYDVHIDQFVEEACQLADPLVDFSQYDWDGDGVVEQVILLFAGTGQNYGTGDDYIFPHEASLPAVVGHDVECDGVLLGSYAAVNEVKPTNIADGLGTFCHEFSHCMGLPDMYDIYYSGNFGMGRFDVLHAGAYNGNSFCPPCYTAYERMQCGWLQPIELTNDTIITGMKPLSEGGETYIIYNKAHPDEYYLLENRAKTGWDAEIYGEGLLVTYVDFDPIIWEYNLVNSTADLYVRYGYPSNDHQRLCIFHADNNDDRATFDTERRGYTAMTEETDPYPIPANDRLTNSSLPAATLYHPNTDGTKFMNIEITDIFRNSADGTISFTFKNHNDWATGMGDNNRETTTNSHEVFDLQGRRAQTGQKGMVIVRQQDGTVRKSFRN